MVAHETSTLTGCQANRRLAARPHGPLLLRGEVADGFLECRSLADTGACRCLFQLLYGLLRQPKRYLRQCAFAFGHPAGRVSVRHTDTTRNLRKSFPAFNYLLIAFPGNTTSTAGPGTQFGDKVDPKNKLGAK